MANCQKGQQWYDDLLFKFQIYFRTQDESPWRRKHVCNEYFYVVFNVMPSVVVIEGRELSGSCLNIFKIEVDERLRRRGYGTKILQWLRKNATADFIFVKCANSDALTALFENKKEELNASSFLPDEGGWIMEK